MAEYTLDFMSPDPEYLIATSFYRDEIDFLITLFEGITYLITMKTLDRVQTTIEVRIGKIDGYPDADCEKGLILVEELNLETMHQAIKGAISQKYFDFLLSNDGMSSNRKAYPSITTEREANRQLECARVADVSTQSHYLGRRLEQTLVTVAFENGHHYLLTLVSPESIAEYFGQLPEERFLAIPGIVVVHDMQEANLEMIVAWCHKMHYFITLQPMS